jgi:Na+-transporting NADH:ubiquinone oxidoreductase subunit NqrA
MKDLSVEIKGVDYQIEKPVFDLIHSISLERDELRGKIEECNELHDELRKRPFRIVTKAEVVDTENHPQLTNLITEKLKNNERFCAKVRINGERIWCIVIGRSDSHNANFDDSEEGQIFVGIIDNIPFSSDFKFNDLIEFQSCDVFDLK